jgi:hypothetical protein
LLNPHSDPFIVWLMGGVVPIPGADVVLTDMAPVLPLLRRNYENNLSPAALKGEPGPDSSPGFL